MLHVRFPLSLRNVEDLLHERGIDVSHETIRYWWNRFGPMFAREIRKHRVRSHKGYRQWQWHLDEVFVKINGKAFYLWRAVDHQGEVLEAFVSKKRDKRAALKFLRKAVKRFGQPKTIVTDKLQSYGAALKDLGLSSCHEFGGRKNNRAENSHQPFRRREKIMQKFRRSSSLQKFASIHASVYNHFNQDRHLNKRQTFKENRSSAMAEWKMLLAV